MTSSDPAVSPAARAPRIDLHRHLDGNLRLSTCLELAKRHRVTLPADSVSELVPYFRMIEPGPDLMSFLERVERMASVLGNADACRRVARENVEDAARERLDYIELRFSPGFMARAHALDPTEVVDAVVAGIREAEAELPIQVQLIGILSRTFGPEHAAKELEALLSLRDEIVALDLAGDEARWPGAEFVDHFRRGRDAGWNVTVHAGEASGPESVWQAIQKLGATRIGHGTRAAEDPKLMDFLAEERIGIESCLTSNVQTNTVSRYQDHPLAAFLDRGILATINTDNPEVSDIDLDHELDVAAPLAGLSRRQVERARHNALAISFLTPQRRQELIDVANSDLGCDAVRDCLD